MDKQLKCYLNQVGKMSIYSNYFSGKNNRELESKEV